MGQESELIVKETSEGVTTLRMNNPKKLNGWTDSMMRALFAALEEAGADPETKAVVLTGTGKYYSAGVNLGGVIQLQHPKAMREFIFTNNRRLFDTFLDFPKPIVAAVNGPAIGASVTTATLCNAIVAADSATFSTPFARLGVPKEGCSSVTFPALFGEQTAERMLGDEGWRPTGEEAVDMGLAVAVVPDAEVVEAARKIAKKMIADGTGRTYPAGMTRQQLKDVNERESNELADAFLGAKFLYGQYEFLWKKNKRGPAMVFFTLWLTRPLWSQLL